MPYGGGMDLLIVGATAPSHVYPSLAAVRELVARGHHVRYVVGDQLAELVTATGAEHVGYRSVLPDGDTTWPEDLGEAMQLFLDEQKLALPLLRSLVAPDGVLYDIGGYSGRVAAHHWQVPAVQLSPTYVAWEGYEQDMAEFTAALKGSPSGTRYFADVRGWLDENDMSIDADAFMGRPDACVVLIPRELQPNAERVGAEFVFTGPCIDTSRTTGWTPETKDPRPLVYIAFGTAYTDNLAIYRACVEALAAEHPLVIATGKVDPAELGALPATARAARAQPQLDVLAHAGAFITHAGMGSAAESLWFGVPTVAIPQAVDQFTNAELLQSAGAGVNLPAEEVTADTVHGAVAEALTRTARARALRDNVRRAGGVAVTADAIERAVRG
jgi:MGT family glycosyltransferase